MLTTDPFDHDKLREECGVFGVFGMDGAAALTALGLHALQHRGQEAAGITSWDEAQFYTKRANGHVAENFSDETAIRQLPGRAAIGHTRYATTGETAMRNVQPLFAELSSGGFAVAHNGNISNALHLRKALNKRGSIFQSTSDTEVIIHLVATSSYRPLLDRLIDALKQVEGAYSLACLTPEGLIAVRDPLGIRPLVLGRLDDAYIVASETVALDIVGATFLRQIDPGEMLIINENGMRSLRPFAELKPRPCIFEHVYFSRPDSFLDGNSVYQVRKNIGRELASENPVDADIVIPVPDSGNPAALGYSQAVGHPVRAGHHPIALCRAHLHPAGPGHSRPVGKAEAQCQPRTGERQVHRARRRFHRARDDQPEDRADDARCGRAGSAHAHRQSADEKPLLLRRRYAGAVASCWRRRWISIPCAPSSRRTAWRSFRSTACIAPWA